MHWLTVITTYYLILYSSENFQEPLEDKSISSSNESETFVSVIIACRNEEIIFRCFFRDISAQDYPSELFEVIIVDDNSTDITL